MAAKKNVSVEPHIFTLRDRRVMLDSELAELYGVDTRQLNRGVKRNRERFPTDFMFQLTAEELVALKCQFGTSKVERGGRRRSRPYAFTQEGVAMLSSVLRSARAIEVNIAIMRAFVRLRQMVLSIDELARRVEDLERGFHEHGQDIHEIFDALRELTNPPDPARPEIGFHVREESARYRTKPRRHALKPKRRE